MQEGVPWRSLVNTHTHRTHRPMLSEHQDQEDAQRPSAEADHAAALDLDLWLPWTSDVGQLTLQVRTRWLLMDIHDIMNRTRTMADVICDHREGRPPPWNNPASGGM